MKWGIIMLLENLIQRFTQVKGRNPLHVNELLDYTQKCYIDESLSIVEYKKLFFELDKRQAKKPSSFFVKVKPAVFDKIS